jgi:hypothetical protein
VPSFILYAEDRDLWRCAAIKPRCSCVAHLLADGFRRVEPPERELRGAPGVFRRVCTLALGAPPDRAHCRLRPAPGSRWLHGAVVTTPLLFSECPSCYASGIPGRSPPTMWTALTGNANGLRSRGEFDGEIAKRFGGGSHRTLPVLWAGPRMSWVAVDALNLGPTRQIREVRATASGWSPSTTGVLGTLAVPRCCAQGRRVHRPGVVCDHRLRG